MHVKDLNNDGINNNREQSKNDRTQDDGFSVFNNRVICLKTAGTLHKMPLFGKVIEVGSDHLTLRRRDGRIIRIKKEYILECEETRGQDEPTEEAA